MKTVLTARSAFTPLDSISNPVITVEDGRIVSVYSRQQSELPANARVMDFGDAILAPGFIDVHIHGGAGYDVMRNDPDGLARLERHLTAHGVTSYCPTTVTAPMDATLDAIAHIAESQSAPRDGSRAKPAGIHLEGPFLSHEKRGVHPPEHLRKGSTAEFEKMWQAAQGKVALMTAAPELEGAPEMIRVATERGVCISLGHSNATLQQAEQGIAAGGRHATHTFNAMRPLDHREPGILGLVLEDERLTADMIVDGVHVHPDVVKIFLAAKGPERAVLITDAISATGMGDGTFDLGKFKVQVKGDRAEYEGHLAGSVLTLDRAVRNVVKFADWKLQQAVRLATLNPARVLRRDDIGRIAPGAQADFVVLDDAGNVRQTIIL